MPVLHVIGIDPGLVHTGCVQLEIDIYRKHLATGFLVVQGMDALAVAAWVRPGSRVFIEKYDPRRKFDSDVRMIKGEAELKKALPDAVLLSNTGIKEVVTQGLMRALGLWSFPTATHHQDLRSAARIALLGMMKGDGTNQVLAEMVRAHLDGVPWTS